MSSNEISNDIQQVKDQSQQLKNLINKILARYEEPFQKLTKLQENLNEREKNLNDREAQIDEKNLKLLEEEQAKLKNIEEREGKIATLERKICNSTTVESQLGKNQIVKLNVGGSVFATNLGTLKSVKDTFFTGYFSEHFHPTPEDDGSFFIDRPFEHFHLILNYLRGIDIKQKLKNMDKQNLEDFMEEIVFYQITPIYEILPDIGKLTLFSKYGIESTKSPQTIELNVCGRFTSRKSYSFQVNLISNCEQLWIGFAPRKPMDRYRKSVRYGYFLCRGKSFDSVQESSYPIASFSNGSTISCELKSGNISYSVDGVDYGVVFKVKDTEQLFPTFESSQACVFELVQ